MVHGHLEPFTIGTQLGEGDRLGCAWLLAASRQTIIISSELSDFGDWKSAPRLLPELDRVLVIGDTNGSSDDALTWRMRLV